MKKNFDPEKFAQLVVEEIHDLREHMDARFDAVDERFEAVDKRFEAVDKRFDAVDKRFEKIENELSHINASLMYITGRLDSLEEKVAGLTGYAKEIDELRARIRAIEHHLKMKTTRKPVRA